MEIADMDGNGMNDIVCLNVREATLSVTFIDYYGRPDHSYHYPTGADPWDASVADVDGDGDRDVLVSCFGARKLQVMNNDGSGYLAVTSETALPGELTSVAGADFDDDGDVDAVVRIIANNPSSQGLFILTNDGAGQFAVRNDILLAVGPDYATSYVGDYDGDGQIDIVVRDRAKIRMARNRGELQFEMVDLQNVSSPYVIFDTGDIDSDGDLDIVAREFQPSSRLTILTNDGAGGFTASFVDGVPNWCDWPLLVDVNVDGLPDVVMSGADAPGLAVMLNTGEGWDTAAEFSIHDPYCLRSTDIDGDGDQDLATVEILTSRFMVRLNCNEPAYIFGDCNDDGVVNMIDAVFLVNYIFAGGPAPEPRLRGDINRDGFVNVSDAVKILNYLFFGESLQ